MAESAGTAKDNLDSATKDEEEREAHSPHVAGRAPTPAEEEAAEGHSVDPDVAEHEKEMGRRGVEVKGEGQID
ncbi:MAG: hypothetical protein ACRDV4_05065 [Acidimicrobiales bacterium]